MTKAPVNLEHSGTGPHGALNSTLRELTKKTKLQMTKTRRAMDAPHARRVTNHSTEEDCGRKDYRCDTCNANTTGRCPHNTQLPKTKNKPKVAAAANEIQGEFDTDDVTNLRRT